LPKGHIRYKSHPDDVGDINAQNQLALVLLCFIVTFIFEDRVLILVISAFIHDYIACIPW
jgi:hypothetical protein